MPVRERQDAWALSVGSVQAAADQAWHPVLDGYARGVALMKQRDTAQPLPADSWLWAAYTHGVPRGVQRSAPTWNSCEHASPYFLPWHRGYLAWFEATIRSLIADPDWALPYWDYTGDDPDRLRVPPEFEVPQRTVGGSVEDNPLFVPGRGTVASRYADVVPAMAKTHYVRAAPDTGFGGSSIKGVNGEFTVEMQPHNYVHGLVGGTMGFPSTAALDPIFWLHHVNIDRLWVVWRGLEGSVDADDPAGLTDEVASDWAHVRFPFGAPDGESVFAPAEVMVTEAAPLEYRYDRTTLDQTQLRRVQELRKAELAAGGVSMGLDADAAGTGEREWTIVGASEQSIRVTGAGAEVEVPVDRRRLGLDQDSTAPSGLMVGVEGVRARSAPLDSYLVEVAVTGQGPYREVGRFSTFGVGDPTQTELRMFYFDAGTRFAELVDDGWVGDPLVVRVSPDPEMPVSDDQARDDLDIEQVTVYQRP